MKDTILKRIIAENALLRAEVAELRAAVLGGKEIKVGLDAPKPAKKKGKK